MKKALIIVLIIFLIILILLSLLLNVFRKNTSPKTDLKITPFPTSNRTFTEDSDRNGTTPTSTDTTGKKGSPESTNTLDPAKNLELLSKTTTLSKTDFLLLEALKKSLPYSSDDFDVEYSSLLNMFIVTKKTSKAMEKFNAWAKSAGIEKLLNNPNLFTYIDSSSSTSSNYSQQSETIFQEQQEAYRNEVINTPELNMFSQEKNLSLSSEESFSFMVQVFKEMFDSFTTPSSTISITPTASSSVTPTYVQTGPGSSSLSELFNEIGQKVGVPPKILEGIMMVEYPSTFDLSSEEIALYSTPGNTIPGCGPNQCSAAGPMQITIGVDGNGSSTCSSCCGEKTCLSSCPNAWLSYGGAVNTYGGYSHTPNPCNLRDNIYAAATKLKSDSGATSATSWTQDEVYRAGKRYYGSCTATPPNLSGLTYCEYLWQYYTKNSEGTGSGSNSSESNTYSNYTYYSQCDDTYGDLALPGGCTLCRAGCGPTTAAMILSSKVDTSYTPQKLIDLYEQNGYQLNCSGSYYSNAKSIIEQVGVQTSDLIFYYPSSVSGSEIIEDVKSYIQGGWTIFALANFRCTAGSCGHFFWIVDVDAQNNILAFDPFYGRYEIPYNESAKSPRYRVGFGVK